MPETRRKHVQRWLIGHVMKRILPVLLFRYKLFMKLVLETEVHQTTFLKLVS